MDDLGHSDISIIADDPVVTGKVNAIFHRFWVWACFPFPHVLVGLIISSNRVFNVWITI